MSRPQTVRLSLLMLILLAGCRGGADSASSPRSGTGMPLALHWMRSSAEYRALLHQTYALAAERLAERVDGREPGTWAVALDGDETVFDNSQYQKERTAQGLDFTPKSWLEWCRRREAGTVPGVRRFLERVEELGGRIVVVSNRTVQTQEDTEANLRGEEIPFDVVLLEVDDGEKEPRWRSVEEGTTHANLPPLEIVMWIGDNIRDFPGLDQRVREGNADALRRFGDSFFVVPNPVYGSWQGNPPR